MAKVRKTFEARDGRSFDTEAAAERHEALVAARRAYEEARRAYMEEIAAGLTTKDGHPFEFSCMRLYYFLVEGFAVKPHLKELQFYLWHCDVDDHDETVIRLQGVQYKISDLYRYRDNACKALVAAQREWLQRQTEELAELEARLEHNA
jgi:hypothetical protein